MNQQTEKSEDQPADNTEELDNDQVEAPSTETESNEEQSDDDAEVVTEDSELAEASREELLEKLGEANNRIEEMKDGYIRAQAEMENVRRRSQNEIVSARKYAIEGFAQELLGVIDSLDQASRVEMDSSSSEAVAKMKEGLELTLKQFDSVMGKFGIAMVEADKGVKFDPEVHQAISMVDSDEVDSEHILDVMQKGYTLKDRLLRPAMVVVAK